MRPRQGLAPQEAPPLRSPLAFALVALLLLAPSAAGRFPLTEPPVVEFDWSPQLPRRDEHVQFFSRSQDPDGVILLHEWTIEGRPDRAYGAQPTWAFPARGTYAVTLHVWDATLARSNLTRMVSVLGTPPVPSIAVEPEVTYRGVPATFLGAATDADGDGIARWRWEVAGEPVEAQNVPRTFSQLGSVDVSLVVEDADGMVAGVSRVVHVENRPPIVEAPHTPTRPVAGQSLTFLGAAMDPDSSGPVTRFEWRFSDGASFHGAEVQRALPAGEHTYTVVAVDSDGGRSAPFVGSISVAG